MADKNEPPPHLERLWKAVQDYVEAEGGKLAVIGKVQVIQWPGDAEFNFTVGVNCTGHPPKQSEKQD